MAEEKAGLSEEELIAEFLAPLAAGFAGAFGLKDDCAVIAPPAGHELVLKTDAVAQGVHFIGDEPPEDIGWKALAVNVSDLIAKGATPVAYLMSLAFPAAPARSWLQGFADGLRQAQAAFQLHLVGGDTDRRPGPASITIMALGTVPAGRMVRRGAAKAGDMLFVSGSLGDAAAGLELARGGRREGLESLAADERDALLARFRRPSPRVGLAPVLLEFAGAAMDLSDGLAKDLGRMARASGVGAVVRTRDVPLSYPLQKLIAASPGWLPAIVAGGDDYEVLAAVPPARADAYRAHAADAGVRVTAIGEVTARSGVSIIGPDGQELQLERTGWDHFR